MRNYEGTSGTDGLGADSDPSDGIPTRMETDSGERTNRGEEQPTAGTTECVVDSDKEAICRTPPEDEREELANIQRGLHPVAGKRRKRECENVAAEIRRLVNYFSDNPKTTDEIDGRNTWRRKEE